MQKLVRLGFLIPPGNPNTEGEVIKMARLEFSVHFMKLAVYWDKMNVINPKLTISMKILS